MNNLRMEFSETRENYTAFLDLTRHASIFATLEFLDSLELPYRLISCYNGNTLVAACPLVFDRDGGPLKHLPEFSQYTGLMLRDFPEYENHKRYAGNFSIAEFFIEELNKKYPSHCICTHHLFDDIRPFQWYHYHEPEEGMYSIDLRYSPILDISQKNFDGYLTEISPTIRYEYRRAKNKLQLTHVEDISVFLELYKKTFARQNIGVTGETLETIRSIVRTALGKKFGTLLFSAINDQVISGVLFVRYKQTAYYLFGVNDPEFRNLNGNVFLLIEQIRTCFADGIQKIDFVGANSPQRGSFKLGFNPELKPFYILKQESKSKTDALGKVDK